MIWAEESKEMSEKELERLKSLCIPKNIEDVQCRMNSKAGVFYKLFKGKNK